MGAVVAAAACVVWFVALSVYDLTCGRLPNSLTVPGAVVVLGVAAGCGRGLPALAGAAALTVVYLAIHLVAPTGMGAGDVKLALGVGGLTGAFGADAWVIAALGAPVLTAGCGLVVGAWTGRRQVPHGPSMCLTATVAIALVCAASYG